MAEKKHASPDEPSPKRSKLTSSVTASPTSAASNSPARFKVTVFGGGTFGTAVGTVIARQGHDVVILVRRKHRAKAINEEHRNPDYLKEYDLPHNLSATMDPKTALEGTHFIVHSVPVQASPAYLTRLKPFIAPTVPIISLSKGVHLETLSFMNKVIETAMGRKQPAAFVSGPSFARELMEGRPTGLVVASESAALAREVQSMLSSSVTRVYVTNDVVGVEVGGALKNIFAIAAGMAEGLGHKMNTAALIVTRGCHEMNKLALALGAEPRTLSGLAGFGDLMLTCFGGASRNRSVGVRLGQGEKLEDIIESMSEVAEGIITARAAARLAEKLQIDLPFTMAICAVLAEERALAWADTLGFVIANEHMNTKKERDQKVRAPNQLG